MLFLIYEDYRSRDEGIFTFEWLFLEIRRNIQHKLPKKIELVISKDETSKKKHFNKQKPDPIFVEMCLRDRHTIDMMVNWSKKTKIIMQIE